MGLRVSEDIERVVVLRSRANGRGKTREKLKIDDDFDPREDDGVKFVVIPEEGRAWRGALQENLGPKKKQSKRLKPIERRVRKMARRQSRMMSMYLDLHDISNRKKKNGWMRDLRKNVRKAVKKSKAR
jgi:hypothetical protein